MCISFELKALYFNVQLIIELCHYFVILLMGMNWHESQFATLCHGDNANWSYQHTFEGRMGTNWHELYIKLIF